MSKLVFGPRSLAIAAALAVVAVPATVSAPNMAVSATSSEGCLPGDLRSKLNQIRSQFGSIQVVSTGRPGARIAGSGRMSLHSDCRAVDFVPPPGKYGQVAAWLRSNHGGGVGTYTCMNHIHIDNGPGMYWSKCR